jgi:hypothetical protein
MDQRAQGAWVEPSQGWLAEIVSPATSAQPRRAQDEILRADAAAIPLRHLMAELLDPFGLERIDLPDTASALEVGQDLCIGLALLLNELATNAVKYGALSQPTGRVRLTCCFTDGLARLDWLESGGPRVQPTRRASFGTLLLGAALASPGGQAPRRFAPSGVVCAMTFPAKPSDGRSGRHTGAPRAERTLQVRQAASCRFQEGYSPSARV